MYSLKTTYRALLIAVLAIITGRADAYDFKIADGPQVIYYNRIDDNTVELTHCQGYSGTPSYTDEVEIPSKITVDGKTYQVTAIGDRAFFNCRDLTSVKIPESVTTIGMWAFAWCDAIEQINLPANIGQIGAYAFDGCYSLKEIKAKKSDRYTDQDGAIFNDEMTTLIAYSPGREGAYDIPEGTKAIADNAFAACAFVDEVTLPEGLTTIGDDAFYFCNSLTEINIPSTVNHIGHSALSDCLSLGSINVDEANADYASIAGVLYDKNKTKLIQCPGGHTEQLEMPEGLQEIGEQAFFRNYAVTNVNLPSTVSTIRQAAFVDCPNLSTIIIPNTVDKIEPMAFAMCENLEGIYLYNDNPKNIDLGEGAFAGVNINQCILFVPDGSEVSYANAKQWGEFVNIRTLDRLMPQTIKWEQRLDSLKIGNLIKLYAESTSGLPIKYVLTPNSQQYAQIKNNNIEITSEGMITITACQPGNGDYLPATPVTRTVKIRPSGIVDPTIAGMDIKVYGGIAKIIIKGAKPESDVAIFDIAGRQVYAGKEKTIPVESGRIYIVTVSNRSYKVGVR